MFSPLRNRVGKRLREPFGKAGLTLAVIALVFAMLGGAYAATNSGGGKATATKAKVGPRGPRGKTGPAGPAGPAGPQGPAGANGANGAKGDTGAKGDAGAAGTPGTPGTPGAAGKSVVATPIVPEPGGACGEVVGGTEFEVEGSATSEHVCNGEEGPAGPPGPEGVCSTANCTLPPGVIETGSWSFSRPAGEHRILVPLTLPIKLPQGLEGSQIHYFTDANFSTFCEGGAGSPKPKNSLELCIYQSEAYGTSFEGVLSVGNGLPEVVAGEERAFARVGGVLVFGESTGVAEGLGSYAVKG